MIRGKLFSSRVTTARFFASAVAAIIRSWAPRTVPREAAPADNRACMRAAAICETFQLGVAVHSSGELGIQLATMLHLGAAVPNLTFAADAHYHHLADDVIVGGKLQYCHGAMPVPTAPGLGVKLDRDRLAKYHELFLRLGTYPYDQDPLRPGWTPLVPNARWADPKDARIPSIPR